MWSMCLLFGVGVAGETLIFNESYSIQVVAYGPGKVDMLHSGATGNESRRETGETLAQFENETTIPKRFYPNFEGYTCKVTASGNGGRIDQKSVDELKNGTGCLATNEAMLENVWRTSNPTVFAHDILLKHEYNESAVPANFDGSLSKLGYSRLMPSADPNCNGQYCPKGPCMVLDMNYFGTASARRHIESAEDSNGDVWNILRGQTYCGPAAGITAPYGSGNVNEILTQAFPQDRQVPSEYTPNAYAGIILPLAEPSKFPNWYFAEGYWGWRQNGPLQESGAPCYGRQVPRWMLPNTCISGNAKACVNGYSNYATHGSGDQWTHTLVDSETTGMNGVYVSSSTENSTENVDVYDAENDKFLDSTKLLEKAKTLHKAKFVGAKAAAYFLAPYYSLPDAGLHGYSQWHEDWTSVNSSDLEAAYASTQARFPVPNTATNWITRTFDASPDGDVSTEIMFTETLPPGYTEESSPQQMRMHSASNLPTPDGGKLHTQGSWHSQRRLEKFTPQGMDSARGFDALGYRVYMHPYFEYYGGVGPSTEYFECSFSDKADEYSCMDTIFGNVDRSKPKVHEVPFAASFINIEQAMRRYSSLEDQVDGDAVDNDLKGGGKDDNMNVMHKRCLVQGMVKHGKTRNSCCVIMVPKKGFTDPTCKTIIASKLSGLISDTTSVSALIEDVKTLCNATAAAGTVAECLKTVSACLAEASTTKAYGKKKCKYGRKTLYEKGQCASTCTAHVLTQTDVDILEAFVQFPGAFESSGCAVPKSSPDNSTAKQKCKTACNYKVYPGSSRTACAVHCWCMWMKFLIPPVEVSRMYAQKWDRTDKVGLGGAAKKKKDESAWYGKTEDTNLATVWDAFDFDVVVHGKALLHMDGRFNDQERTQSAKFGKKAMEAVGVAVGSAIAIAVTAGAATGAIAAADASFAAGATTADAVMSGASAAVPSLTDATVNVAAAGSAFDAGSISQKTTNSATKSHEYDETGVNEQLCDLAICDIASSELDIDSDAPFRCVPRGYAYAQFGKKGEFTAKFSGTRTGDGTYGKSATNGGEGVDWYSLKPADDWVKAAFYDAKKYYFKISLPKGADKSWRGAAADYKKAVPASFGNNKTEFKPTPRDAGYSQKRHDNDNYACTCGEQGGIEMYTSILSEKKDRDRFQLPTTVPFYDPQVHALVEISMSWANPNPLVTATKGLYMAGTRGTTEWIERDVLDRRKDPVGPGETYTRFLAPHAPSANAAIGMVYSREPRNTTVTSDEAASNNFRGLRNNEYVKEYLTITANSCVRFPIGVLHRAQMSDEVRDALYNDAESQITNFSSSDEPAVNPGFTPTLQGYCELINGMYRFCPNAPHKTVKQREEFCRNNMLASNFLVGVRIDYRPVDKRCSSKWKICVIVPGSVGDPANPLNFVQGDPSEGLIKAHTTQEFAGYTILVTPFNRTTFQSVLTHRYQIPMVLPDPARKKYMLLNPLTVAVDTAGVQEVNATDSTLTGFREDRNFFKLMSDLDRYLAAVQPQSTNNAAITIQRVIDNAVKIVFMGTPGNASTDKLCSTSAAPRFEVDPQSDVSSNLFIVPNPDMMGGETKRCINKAQLFPPNPESAILVAGSGITVKSASTTLPLQFGGETAAASTCSRFVVAATAFAAEASFDQAGCLQQYDDFLKTPIQFIGTDVSNGNVAVTTTGDHSVAVAVVGKDSEFFPATTNLTANNLKIKVTYSNFNREPGSFDVAFASVNGDAAISVAGAANVRLLLQGVGCADRLDQHRPMLKLTGNNTDCVDGTLLDTVSDTTGAVCEFVNVTEYTSLFGYRFEHRLFRTHVRSVVLAWILLTIFLFVSAVAGIYILVAPNVAVDL